MKSTVPPLHPFFISPTGSNANPGTEAQPWRTIQHAAETLQAGETVLIRAGEYKEWVRPQHSGEAGKPITYAAYPGEVVTLNGAEIELPADTPRMPRKPHPTHDWTGAHIGHPVEMGGLFQIEERSHIIVKGLRVINAGPHRDNAGILVKDCDNIRIEGNFTYNTVSSGIGVWRSYKVVITGNEIELACNDGGQECLTVAGTDEFEVSHNHIHHSGPCSAGGEGIDIKHGCSNGRVHHNHVHHIVRLGIYIEAWNTLTRDIEIYQNLIHDNFKDGIACASEAGGLLTDIKIYNNLIFDNGLSGFVVGWYGEDDILHQPIRNISVVNNTIVNNGTRNEGGGIWLENYEAENILIQNNIVSENRLFQIAVRDDTPATCAVLKNNLTFGYNDHSGEMKSPLHADPKLVDAKRGNFRSLSDSPALAAGLRFDGLTSDYSGHPRSAENPDLGAYQWLPSPVGGGAGGDGNFRQSFPLQGFLRDYYVHLPEGKHPAAPVPLILFLHGLESEASQLRGFDKLSDRFGFVAVYPNSLPTDDNAWNVGAELNPHVDDVTFIRDLLDVLVAEYNIDPRRIYIGGHSNGGAMVQRLACEISDRVAAFASSAGLLVRAIAENAQLTRPVPLMHIHGDADPTVPWEGCEGRLSVEEMLGFWIQANGCESRPVHSEIPHKDQSDPRFELDEYRGENSQACVTLIRARNGDHDFFGEGKGYDIDANAEMWRFFQKFAL